MPPITRPRRAHVNTSHIVVFIVIWSVIFVIAFMMEIVAAGLASWGDADSSSTRYTDPLNLVHILFVLTQVGALLGGLFLLRRGTVLLNVMALAGGLYLIWAIGWAWACFR